MKYRTSVANREYAAGRELGWELRGAEDQVELNAAHRDRQLAIERTAELEAEILRLRKERDDAINHANQIRPSDWKTQRAYLVKEIETLRTELRLAYRGVKVGRGSAEG